MLIRTMKMLTLFGCVFALLTVDAQAKDVVFRPPVSTDRVIVFIHGSGGHASDLTKKSIEGLLEYGFAVAASDADGPQNWGNPASVADYEHLIHRLGYKRIYLAGGSMGGLDAMQLLGRVHPEAVALTSPVCDLSRLGVISPVAIEQAWGKSRPAYLSPVVPHPEKGLPVDIWASPEDTWVPKRWNANVCARELRHRGAIVHEFSVTGDHPEAAPGPNEILDFFESARPR
jgi:pimeloyl-ACP methyl ester carboxylesterase